MKQESDRDCSEEEATLDLIYQSKGLTQDEADLISRRVMADAEAALDTMTREDLGLDPNELGSPWGAALASFAAFVGGAIVPILPFLFSIGNSVIISAALSAVALLLVGGSLAAASGNKPWGRPAKLAAQRRRRVPTPFGALNRVS